MRHTKSPALVATMDHFFLGTVAEPWCEEEEETEEGLGWLPCSFNPDSPFEKKWLQTNGPTDGPTDGQTYRVASARFKIVLPFHSIALLSFQINVRRGFLYEDAFEKLSPENEQNMKLRMRVQMQNAVGM